MDQLHISMLFCIILSKVKYYLDLISAPNIHLYLYSDLNPNSWRGKLLRVESTVLALQSTDSGSDSSPISASLYLF